MSVQKEPKKQGQESVWDYPRPPRLEATTKPLRVVFNGKVVAETHNAYRVLETSHPPVYYIPLADIHREYLKSVSGQTFCEFKGAASYWTLEIDGKVSERAAWSYANPTADFRAIKDHLAFYASRVDECYVSGERVIAQEGDFYGGWITSDIVGPFKGGLGTRGW